MRVAYRVVIKRGYIEEFEFMETNLREAGYIADIFLDKLVRPDSVDIKIEPIKIEEPTEEELSDE